MIRKCKICKTILKGRIDQQFCSVKCKNFYHINLRKVTKENALGIDRHLHRNRSILLEIMGKKDVKKKVPRILLEEKKFHFTYITHYLVNSQGKTWHYVYDFAYMTFSDNEILIVRKGLM